MIRVRVIVASNRAAAGVYADTSGPILVDGLRALGHEVADPVVVPDGEPVAEAIREAVDAGTDVVVTSGGTGISPTDRTPEVTTAVVDYEVPGIAEALRAYGAATTPMAVLSRGVAGVVDHTLVVNLPGSTGGAKDGLAVLAPILEHAVAQLRGGDHPTGHTTGHHAGQNAGRPSSQRAGPAAGGSFGPASDKHRGEEHDGSGAGGGEWSEDGGETR